MWAYSTNSKNRCCMLQVLRREKDIMVFSCFTEHTHSPVLQWMLQHSASALYLFYLRHMLLLKWNEWMNFKRASCEATAFILTHSLCTGFQRWLGMFWSPVQLSVSQPHHAWWFYQSHQMWMECLLVQLQSHDTYPNYSVVKTISSVSSDVE